MARTFITQATQVFESEVYQDNLTPGPALSGSAQNLEDDLNALRTQVKLLMNGTGTIGNWWDDLNTYFSGSSFPLTSTHRGVNQIEQGLFNSENKQFLYRVEMFPTQSIFVSSSQNWIVLAASGETPQLGMALGTTTNGAVVAKLTASFGSNQLITIQGTNPTTPKNLAIVVTASNGNVLESTSTGVTRNIYALLHVTASAVDGANFDNTTNALQLSFVIESPTGGAFVPCPVVDIAGAHIYYAYAARQTYTALPEDSYLNDNMIDFVALSDVSASITTLAQAIQAQGAAPFTAANSINWGLSPGEYVSWNSTGSQVYWRISVNGVSTVAGTMDNFNITNTNAAKFAAGASFATASADQINVGVTTGQIDAAGALTVKAVQALLLSGSTVSFSDQFTAGSTYTGSLPVGNALSEWNNFKAEYGNVSILQAFHEITSSLSGTVHRRVGTAVLVSGTQPANTNLSTSTNLSGSLPSLVGTFFDNGPSGNVAVYVNGVRQNLGQSNDVYTGSNNATGDLKFTYNMRPFSVIIVDTWLPQ